MMSGSIGEMLLERVEQRENERLSAAWVGTEKAQVSAVLGLSRVCREDENALLKGEKGAPVLGMLRGNHKSTLDELLQYGKLGKRVYVLAALGWGEGDVDSGFSACPAVLVRRLKEVPVSGVYCAGAAKLWMGGVSSDRAPWGLFLDEQQAEAFRQLFLRLFWHDAVEEAWNLDGRFSFRVVGKRPFDIPELSSQASLRLVDAGAKMDVDMSGALVHLGQGAPPEQRPRRLWFPVGGAYHEGLAELVRGGVEVLGEHKTLPDVVLGVGRGMALLAGKSRRLRIELNAAQRDDVAKILEQPASFRFGVGLRLGDFSLGDSRFWLRGAKEAQSMSAEELVKANAVNADHISGMPREKPSSWPSAHPLALRVRYCWAVRPPRVPKGASEDPLAEQWRKVDAAWMARLEGLGDVLAQAEENRGRIGKLFSALMGAMSGFGREHEKFCAKLEELLSCRLSVLEMSEAGERLRQLGELEEGVKQHKRHLEESEDREREKQEQEKQRQAWKEGVEKAKRGLLEKRELLRRKEEEQRELQDELSAIKRGQEQQGEGPEAKKDLKVQRHRVTDDLKKLGAEMDRLKSAVEALVKEAEKPFVFEPPQKAPMQTAKGGNRFVPPASSDAQKISLPLETLPRVGQLRRDSQGQRYLVIKIWEEVSQGEQESLRLQAKLVAEEQQ